MFQHLTDHIDITAGCVISILELDHVGQFLIRGDTDDLFSGALCGFHGIDLILIDTPEYISGICHLGYQICIIIYESSFLLYVRVQRIRFLGKRCFQGLCRSLILGRKNESFF